MKKKGNKKKIKKNIHAEGKLTKKMRENPWMVSTLVLGVLFLILLIGDFIPEKDVLNINYDFAECLTEKGIKMYGLEGCSFCRKQKELFGDAFKNINYIDCNLNKSLCVSLEIQSVPTWEINGEKYLGLHSLERLSSLSGCELK